MIDFLRPIHGGNRDEILLMQFEGFLKNKAETVFTSPSLDPAVAFASK